MGQKVNPNGFRLVTRKRWLSNWFATKANFGNWVGEDFKVREFLQKRYPGASRFLIERGTSFKVTIVTSRPGLIIGKKGVEIEALRKDLSKLLGRKDTRDVFVEVEEIKFQALDAKCVADSIARQLERRLPFRRILKKAMQETMGGRAGGIKVQVSGRIGGAEIARTEWYKEGRTPLHTLKANIDYAHGRAETTYGSIGVKVWIYLGDEVVAKPKLVVGG